jgi:hypothetical protein
MLTVNAQTYQITIDRADDQTIRFTVTDSAGAALDVSAGTFKLTVKASLDDAIGSAAFQKTSPAANGIDLTLAATGIVDVNIVPADTDDLAGLYHYDLEMTLSSKVRTLRRGIFFVSKDVSTPGSGPASSSVTEDYGAAGLASEVVYLKDATTGLYWKMYMTGGDLTFDGPEASFPF